ncbi:hypothetical protein FTO70_15620 [Methanosarcina sp. KYL-1]|uniref:hypothetical protein n=1 Tax=Methanosarcina sp. KYL-1 TaxID=2602068 RepID=UPI002100F347|nr:hypothetical protein [Methanosarcina sp. KYL-1]MCQ1537074.1 hypothetical protein [Methanosarcina sp. KYL-1]
MFWSKDDIVERLAKIPRTLEDISVEIFKGVPSTNDFLHRVNLSRDSNSEATYVCRKLYRNVNIEHELMYPYMDGALSNEFAIRPTQYRFMLPYDIPGTGIRKEYRIIQPGDLEARFPLAYKRLLEIKTRHQSGDEELDSADCYRLEEEKFLEYINTPKIVVTDHYRLQASYDAAGNHVFAEGVGVVLGDPAMYHYVTAVLNSSVSRVFPEIWTREKMRNNGGLYPKMLKRFPITFPADATTETLISTISRYLIYLNGQKQTTSVCSLPCYQNLIDFYKRIADLLILDIYLTKDLDPKFLEILVENITLPEDEFEYSNDMSLMIALQAIQKNILDAPDFRKCKFNNEFTNILATLKNNGAW